MLCRSRRRAAGSLLTGIGGDELFNRRHVLPGEQPRWRAARAPAGTRRLRRRSHSAPRPLRRAALPGAPDPVPAAHRQRARRPHRRRSAKAWTPPAPASLEELRPGRTRPACGALTRGPESLSLSLLFDAGAQLVHPLLDLRPMVRGRCERRPREGFSGRQPQTLRRPNGRPPAPAEGWSRGAHEGRASTRCSSPRPAARVRRRVVRRAACPRGSWCRGTPRRALGASGSPIPALADPSCRPAAWLSARRSRRASRADGVAE